MIYETIFYHPRRGYFAWFIELNNLSFHQTKKDAKREKSTERYFQEKINEKYQKINPKSKEIVPLEALSPEECDAFGKHLSEIKDDFLIAQITQTFPVLAQVASRTAANAALGKMEVYKAILPAGETLASSRAMDGACRGFSMGKEGIQSHANFIKVNVKKTVAVADGIANMLNITSLIVGQYYMSQIGAKLEKMTENMEKISDFQNRELKSRMLSVMTLVSEISKYRAEIMLDHEQIQRKLTALDNAKGETTQLLWQINLTITESIEKSRNLKFEEYKNYIAEFHSLLSFQEILLSVLEEISHLTYLLGKGSILLKTVVLFITLIFPTPCALETL